MTTKNTIKAFASGTHNRISDELIPADAASSSIGWLTKDGRVELMYGRKANGAEGATGKVYAEHVAYRVDGTAIRYRKAGTKIQYLNGSTWTDVVTGLTVGDCTFSNYFSLAGAFVYVFDPLNNIYKICTANPASYASMYDSTKNFKGYAFIDKGRTIMWSTVTDKTGLYGSKIDPQTSAVYTAVTGEATTSLSGTLAFKAGGATRTCFAVQITLTGTGEVYSDNYNGVLTGSLGGTGTINYMTGAYTVTNSGVGTVNYQWEDSNTGGITDFRKSTTRVAGEGFVVRQDAGGDSIKVVVPLDGSYFSMKENSIYRFELDATDLNPVNEIFRTEIGVQSLRSACATSSGIVYIDTGNASGAKLSIVQRNPVGDNFNTVELFPHFSFDSYTYSDAALEAWDEYVLVACKEDSSENNRLLMCSMTDKTVDVAPYGVRAFAKDSGFLYGGDPVSLTSYELFTGFDDMGLEVTNEWISKNDNFDMEELKKVKKYRFRGRIDPNQTIAVYMSTDNGDFQRIGTIVGSADYVDYNSTYAIGTSLIGADTIGGGDDVPIYNFLMEIKFRVPKWRKRRIKFVAEGFGYCAIQQLWDWDIWTFADKLPKTSRLTQNVSIDGLTVDQDEPEY
jgi:hypothetical protein